MADDTLEPRSTVATLHRPEIDAQVDPQPYKDAGMMHTVPMPATGAPIKWAPAQPMQDKVNADNRAQPGMYDKIKSVFTGDNPYVK